MTKRQIQDYLDGIEGVAHRFRVQRLQQLLDGLDLARLMAVVSSRGNGEPIRMAKQSRSRGFEMLQVF